MATSKKSKMTKDKSFDLNKDGKTTFKDVLIGRGVIPKKKMGGSCGTPKRLGRGK